MKGTPLITVAYHFHGMTVIVPKQKGNDIVAVDLGSVLPPNIQKQTSNFKLIRHIANIVLYDKKDYDRGKLTPVKDFDPPIEIHVGYRLTDVRKSKGNFRKLKLAYWDGKKWVLLSDPTHQYMIFPRSTRQIAEATIWSWVGDPPIGWGT